MTSPCLTITTHACPEIGRLLEMLSEAMSRCPAAYGVRAIVQDIRYRGGGIWRDQIRDGLFEESPGSWRSGPILGMEIDGGMPAALAVLMLQSAVAANRPLNILSGEFAADRDGEVETTAFYFAGGILVIPADSFRIEAMLRSGEAEILGRMLVPGFAPSNHGRISALQAPRLAVRAMEGLLHRGGEGRARVTCREGTPV